MKKLLLFICLLPLFAQGQFTNQTVRKTIATGVLSTNPGLDTIPRVTGVLTNGYILKYNSSLGKWYAAAESVPSLSVSTVSSGGYANGLNYASGVFRLGKVSATHPGVLTTGTDTIAGGKNFTGIITTLGVNVGSSGILMNGATASTDAVFDASKGLISNAITGTGNSVRANSPTLVTPNLGTPSTLVGTNITGSLTNITALTATGSGIFGNANIGVYSGGSTYARFGHTSYTASGPYGFLQNSNGSTYISGTTNEIFGDITVNSLTGSGNRIVIANGSNVLNPAVIGSGLSFDGTTLTATGGSSGSITGTLTSGYLPIATGASSIGNSIIQGIGGTIRINGALAGASSLTIFGSQSGSSVGVNVALNGDWTMPSAAILTTSPTSSAGGYELLTRNTSTGVVEKVASSLYMPVAGGTFTGAIAGTTATFSGDVTANSDRRLKGNIQPLKSVSDALREIGSYSFDWKSDSTHSIGLIAQEIKKHFPELVKMDSKGILSVNYMNFSAVLLQGWKEQDARINQLYIINGVLGLFLILSVIYIIRRK